MRRAGRVLRFGLEHGAVEVVHRHVKPLGEPHLNRRDDALHGQVHERGFLGVEGPQHEGGGVHAAGRPPDAEPDAREVLGAEALDDVRQALRLPELPLCRMARPGGQVRSSKMTIRRCGGIL